MSIEDAEIESLNRKTSHRDFCDRTSSQSIANIAVTVNDTVTVTDTVNVSESKEELRTPEIFKEDERSHPLLIYKIQTYTGNQEFRHLKKFIWNLSEIKEQRKWQNRFTREILQRNGFLKEVQ